MLALESRDLSHVETFAVASCAILIINHFLNIFQTSGLNLTTTSDGMAPNNTNPDNNNIENFGSSKRLRLDGGVETGSPLTPPSFKENNNKSGESLLSQALAEKPAMLNFMSNNGGGRSDGHDDSGASDTGSERPESMLDGSMKTESNQMPSFDLHRYVFLS